MKGQQSPWGIIDRHTNHAPGIDFVSTPSHGGFRLSPERFAELCKRLGETPKLFCRSDLPGYWFEEDCDARLVAKAFFDILK